MDKINTAIPVSGTSFTLGSIAAGKFFDHFSNFARFEITIDDDSIINGLRYKTIAGGVSAGTTIPLTGGFCIRQTLTNAWQGPDGTLEWLVLQDVPMGRFNTVVGFLDDLTVWQGSAPAFKDSTITIEPDLDDVWSIGEGTLSGTSNVTGMISQLTAYLADPVVKATRGATATGAISALFQLYRTEILADSFQTYFAQSDGSGRFEVLEIDWTAPSGRTTARTLTRPPESATLTKPAESATLARPVESATLARPAESATLERPAESTDLKRPPESGTLVTE